MFLSFGQPYLCNLVLVKNSKKDVEVMTFTPDDKKKSNTFCSSVIHKEMGTQARPRTRTGVRSFNTFDRYTTIRISTTVII